MDRFDELMVDVLNGPFNHRATRETQVCIDHAGKPVPWYTFPALEYLEELDTSDKRVFEYGSGASTHYWADRCREVISVEQDQQWYDKALEHRRSNQESVLRSEQQSYVSEIERHGQFDIIVIDGEWRIDCARYARKHLNEGGLVILDNSDWYVRAAQRLREDDFLQVDMKGFGPINIYCWCTTLFFDRAFNFAKRHKYQPVHGLGARTVLVEEEWPDGVPDPLSIR